jgi:hypothetical protein
MSQIAVYLGNTTLIELTGLKDAETGALVSDASVTVTIKTVDGAAVTGQSWPAAMDAVTGGEGDYAGILEHDLDLTAGTHYVAHVDAVAGADRRGHWEFVFRADIRRGA